MSVEPKYEQQQILFQRDGHEQNLQFSLLQHCTIEQMIAYVSKIIQDHENHVSYHAIFL